MREEMSFDNLDSVTGGRYVINGNTHQVAFRDIRKIFKLKNCSDYQAMEVMDSLIGIYDTEAEYDNACVNKLRSLGWIE